MSALPPSPGQRRAQELAGYFAGFAQVAAVALGGSLSSGAAGPGSDIDLYVYTDAELPLAAQAALIAQSAGDISRADVNLPYWGGVNMWVDAASGITVDCIYFGAAWMEEQVLRVMEAHQPSMGYSTCFCRTVRQSQALYDPRGWFAALQALSRQAYPEALRRNIIAYNYPLLRSIMSSYLHQVESAARRGDLLSVNHRVAALLASYFDIVFALNRVLHPGEKRLLAFAQAECNALPQGMDGDVAAVLAAAGAPGDAVVAHLDRLLDRLDELLSSAGLELASLKPV
jgi:hypothetical protein